MAYVNETKHTGSYGNETKHTGSFTNYLRHGKEPTIAQLENYTFASVVFMDGTTLEGVTFAELGDIIYTNQTKHS